MFSRATKRLARAARLAHGNHSYRFAPGAAAAAAGSLSLAGSLGAVVLCEAPRQQQEQQRPKPALPADPAETRLKAAIAEWTLDKPTMDTVAAAFQKHLQMGLESRGRQGAFKMLDTCVAELPSGRERGVFYAVDFGGTNLRVARVALDGRGGAQATKLKTNLKSEGPKELPKGLMERTVTATDLFAFMADLVNSKIQSFKDGGDGKVPVGFTFSFPFGQTRLEEAVLATWTKEFETGRSTNDPVEGRDAGALLQAAFESRGVPAKLVAVLNDTVGTLLSAAYEQGADPTVPPVTVGVILGTGTNGCYFEEAAGKHGYIGRVINIEYGNFSEALPRTAVDVAIDAASDDAKDVGQQQLEKMVSGRYMGEMCRRLFLEVAPHQNVPPLANVRDSFPAEFTSIAVADETPGLSRLQQAVQQAWRAALAPEELALLRTVCKLVMDRSAALAAVSIGAVCMKSGRMDKGGLTVAIDGSLYTQNPWYAERLRHHLSVLLGEKSKLVHIVTADDGSGKGAAILAAVASKGKAQ